MVSLIWAMMILPLADTLQNCFQNLTSRIAGIDNEQMTNRVMGMGAMMGFGLSAIKEQFKTPSQNVSNSNNDNSKSNGIKGYVTRAKEVISPALNLSPETDYSGNVNPIRNVEKKANTRTNNEATTNNKVDASPKNIAKNVLKAGYNVSKTYLKMGASLAEGKVDNNLYKNTNSQNKFQSVEHINNKSYKNANKEKIGDKNEFEKNHNK